MKQPFHELLERYLFAANITTADINPDSLEITFPNGLSGRVANDMENVLGANDVPGRFSLEQACQLGLVVGAAMQRDGMVPERFQDAVESIRSPKQ